MKAIEAKNLHFKYKGSEKEALKGINFSQDEGQFVALMGPMGAGKSTLCRCLNGLIPNFIKGDFQGEVRILHENILDKKVHDLAQRVGLVFQDFESQLFSTTVQLEVVFGPENFGIPVEEIERRLKDCLNLMGLAGFENRDPSTLSGGEKQRLAIASILALKPKILVLDEPTTDLDPEGKRTILSLRGRLRREIPTILMVEHETDELLTADKAVIMNEGGVVVQGSPSTIFKQLDLLNKHGVQPRQLDTLFHLLHIDAQALSPQEALDTLRRAGWSLDPARSGSLADRRDYGELLISVEDLSYSYDGSRKALDRVSLQIRRGEFVGILGQNGCGKTTLVKHFNRLLLPSSGRVLVFGRDTREWKTSQLGRRIGYVFQNPDHQIFANTVQEEVAFGPRNFGLSEDEIAFRVRQALKEVGLEGYEDKDPFSLTKGERQKVAIASVLASRPEVIILDEPTTGLDYWGQRAVMNLLRVLNEKGHTIIIITHCMWAAAEYCHRCVVMAGGKILKDGATREVFGDEEVLAEASLRAPAITQLGNLLGITPLSVQEMRDCLCSST